MIDMITDLNHVESFDPLYSSAIHVFVFFRQSIHKTAELHGRTIGRAVASLNLWKYQLIFGMHRL